MTDTTTMYSDRVGWYVRGRPPYPPELFQLLPGGGLPATAVAADIGSGTGILTELSLRNGNRVYAVEPNADMRAAAEQAYGDQPGFVSVAGSAESTGLPSGSVDLVTVGQALHWFDLPAARAEFSRILRPGGLVLLVWNEQVPERCPVQAAVDSLLQELVPGLKNTAAATPAATDFAAQFFGQSPWTARVLANHHLLDYDTLLGRVLSNSYAPARTDPVWPRLVAGLHDLHQRHARDGVVRIDYDTQVIYGQLDGDQEC
jgi:SAM-dependent methyltransferase